MRIVALHNIRQPGLIPNGFQKEKAPAPAPDQDWQPEMRIKSKAMTETRHAVEYLNPRVHLEINAANRTNTADRPAIEMGREREQALDPGGGKETDAEFNRRVAAYEQLLKALLERIEISHQPRPMRADAGRVETEGAPGPKQAHVVPGAVPGRNPSAPPASYYFRRAVQAYQTNTVF